MISEKYVVCVNWSGIRDVGNDIPLSDTSTILGIMLMSGMNSFRFSNTYSFGMILNRIAGQNGYDIAHLEARFQAYNGQFAW